jgi:hypothetical protein
MIACIPTKNRPNTKTYQLFESVGIKAFHFLEPQEFDKSSLPNKINIQQNSQGIAYVRNFIIEWAKANGEQWIIMCDDDVNQFGFYKNGIKNKAGAGIWFDIKQKAEKLPFEIFGINYLQHAWHEKKAYSINKSFVEVCVLLNVDKINWSYRKEFNLKEDRDFVLQTISKGNGILRFNKHYYSCPAVGTNKGGLQNEYQAKRDEDSAYKMYYEYAPHTKMQNKDGRIDVKIDVAAYATQNKRIVK